MPTWRRPAGVCAVVLLAALPGVAAAGVVDKRDGVIRWADPSHADVGAEPEDNHLLLEWDPAAGELVLTELAGAPIAAGEGCTQPALEPVVRCAYAAGDDVDLRFGRGTENRLTNAVGSGTPVSSDTVVRAEADFDHAVTFTGGATRDVLVGSADPDTLQGRDGDDVIVDGRGSDRVEGGAGDDVLVAEEISDPEERDELDGGAGRDTVSYAQLSPSDGSGVTVDLAAGTAVHGANAEHDVLRAIEDVVGSPLADAIAGDGGANRIEPGAGDDGVRGGDGDDVLVAGAGADGADGFDGGGGRDTLDYGARTARVFVDLARADAVLGAEGERDAATAVEVVRGGTAGDHLRGGPAADTLDAGPGEDLVEAHGGGTDTVACGEGADTARVDRADATTACELVEFPSAGVDAGPATSTAPPPDRTGPAFALGRRRPVRLTRSGRLRLVLAPFAEPVTVSAGARARGGGLRLGAQRRRAGAGRAVVLTLRVPARTRALLRRRGALRAVLTVVARDAAGNATSRRASLIVRPYRRPGR